MGCWRRLAFPISRTPNKPNFPGQHDHATSRGCRDPHAQYTSLCQFFVKMLVLIRVDCEYGFVHVLVMSVQGADCAALWRLAPLVQRASLLVMHEASQFEPLVIFLSSALHKGTLESIFDTLALVMEPILQRHNSAISMLNSRVCILSCKKSAASAGLAL